MGGENQGLQAVRNSHGNYLGHLEFQISYTLKLRIFLAQSIFNLTRLLFFFFGVKVEALWVLPHGLVPKLSPATWTPVSATIGAVFQNSASCQNSSSMNLGFVQGEFRGLRSISSIVLGWLPPPVPSSLSPTVAISSLCLHCKELHLSLYLPASRPRGGGRHQRRQRSPALSACFRHRFPTRRDGRLQGEMDRK